MPVALSFFLLAISLSQAQVSLRGLDLEHGEYAVGFLHYVAIDSSRTYNRVMEYSRRQILREIPTSIWYPADMSKDAGSPMSVINYMEILKEEEEWEELPNEFILNWFYYPNTSENQKHLEEEVIAARDACPIENAFPTVVYAPSYQASSIENFALCEFLASRGYVVISSPSRGPENRFLNGGSQSDLETQARDIEFLVKVALGMKNVDEDAIATMGFSFGGMSNVLSQIRNGNIKANISLDGSVRYQYPLLRNSPYFAVDKVDVPFIHMAQKQIPEQVLKEDKIDPSLNKDFEFYDKLTKSEAYSLRFNSLSHAYFSSLGILFEPRDIRQDSPDAEIMVAYKWLSEYTLKFLEAYLKEDKEARAFLETAPEKNGVPAELISIRFKKPTANKTSFEDFNDMAAGFGYKGMLQLYDSIKKDEADFRLEEAKLNTLGLQLVLDPRTSTYGIAILELAVALYPESANLFDSLAEGYLFSGDSRNAIVNFEKSLQLNKGNQNAIDRLKELKE